MERAAEKREREREEREGDPKYAPFIHVLGTSGEGREQNHRGNNPRWHRGNNSLVLSKGDDG